jgi:hypothetical protein
MLKTLAIVVGLVAGLSACVGPYGYNGYGYNGYGYSRPAYYGYGYGYNTAVYYGGSYRSRRTGGGNLKVA